MQDQSRIDSHRRKMMLGGMAGSMAVATGTVMAVTEGRAFSAAVTDKSPLMDMWTRWQAAQGEVTVIEAEMDRLEATWPGYLRKPEPLVKQIRALDSQLDMAWDVRAAIEEELIAAPAATVHCLHFKLQVLLRNWDCDTFIESWIGKVADDAGRLAEAA